jgi:hypothetical protein
MTSIEQIIQKSDDRFSHKGSALRFRSLLVPVLCLTVLIFAFASAYHRAGDPMDEGMVLLYPELIQHGEVPYRDFESIYGPGNWYFLAGVYGLFGTHINVERTVGLADRLACVLAIFALTRRWGLPIATCCMLLAGAILISSGIEALSWYGAMAFALSAIVLLVRSTSFSRCAVAGLLAGIAILFRVDVSPALMLAALPILWNLDWRKRAVLSGVAGATALLPLLAIACFAGAGTVLHNIFFVPVIYSSPAHKIPFSTVEPRLAQFFVVHLVAAIVNIAAAVVAVRREQNQNAALAFLAAALFAAGITHQPYHRLDFVHLLFALFATIPFMPHKPFIPCGSLQQGWPRSAPLFSSSVCTEFGSRLCSPCANHSKARGVRCWSRKMGAPFPSSLPLRRRPRASFCRSWMKVPSLGKLSLSVRRTCAAHPTATLSFTTSCRSSNTRATFWR